MRDEDIVMESPTDSPEQIADGLEATMPAEPAPAAAAAASDDTPVEDAQVEEAPIEASADEPSDATPVGEVTPHPHRGTAGRRDRRSVAVPGARKQRQARAVDGAAAAARRTAKAEDTARLTVLEAENAAYRRRLEELAAGRAPTTETPERQPASATTTAVAIPDTHPAVAAAKKVYDDLVASRPNQDDFDDFDKFQIAKDEWLEDRAVAKLNVQRVREGAAVHEQREMITAQQAAQATRTAFEQTVGMAMKRHADYDDVMVHARAAKTAVSDDVGIAVMESNIGGELAYYFAKNQNEVKRINELTPHRQLAELGRIEAKIAAEIRLEAPPRTTPSHTVRTTRAPEPQRAMVGDLPGVAHNKDLNDPNLSQNEYNRLRDEMDVQSGRRARLH